MNLGDRATCCNDGRMFLLLCGKEADEDGPRQLFWCLKVGDFFDPVIRELDDEVGIASLPLMTSARVEKELSPIAKALGHSVTLVTVRYCPYCGESLEVDD